MAAVISVENNVKIPSENINLFNDKLLTNYQQTESFNTSKKFFYF